ncbi:TIGR01777 family oxidoreductase [Prolixibacteraceae bacterium Z1-6]|uniref:TIGR01777 family oxidoreductase n=1 Tax=Draconibacterium aestuarii TaxID=2998507 RepID=A0A9X3F9J0_9BACT|nr:TIGR01777 family oxidoreductase [Prolixibacteraceae bacterium Z1-6]
MKIKISGINGYLGKLISKKLMEQHHEVSGIDRELLYDPVENLKNEINGCDVIINLAGASILKRWTSKNRQLIYNSRVKTTTNLVTAINMLKPEQQPKQIITASAIGIYKPGIVHDENSTYFSTDFIGKVVADWEDTLNQLPPSVHQTVFRLGMVLGKDAKTITNLLLPFNLRLGGKIGSGNQAFPFIHETDVVNAFLWAVETNRESQTFNLVAPQNISNKDFTRTFANKLNRPAFIAIPAFVIKLILGKASMLLLESPIVNPTVLLDSDFEFQYPTIDSTLTEILT